MSDPRAILPNLSPEEELILCAARPQLSANGRARLRDLLAQPLDWARIDAIAAVHRARPTLFKHLKAEGKSSVPPAPVWTRIQNHAIGMIARNLSQTDELVKTLRLFREAGIEAIPFKGPMLALRDYGNLGLREFFDIDLLLRRDGILKAKKILLARGYTSPWKQNDEWEAQHIDAQLGCDFLSADGRIRFELHWSFIQKWLSYGVDIDAVWSRAEPSSLAGFPIRQIAREDLLVYLCAHGAKHHWERLFWIVDIAQVVSSDGPLDWARLIRDARRHGNWRILALGLRLADTLLDAPLPENVRAQINADAAVERLARSVGTWLFDEGRRPASGSWVETQFYLAAKERPSDRASYLFHLMRLAMAPSEKDRAFVKLPPSLAFLYPAVRPVRWLLQRGRP